MLKPATSRRKKDQGGFILLVVFLMAGAVALMLYAQLPRVAFESEREKEQLLIERGEQYIRAIQLYQADNAGQWPQSIDDLERGKNKRYLRRRYIDPYTGKDDWRLIHTNGVQLTDSLVEKPPTDPNGGSQSASSSSSSSGAQNQEQQVNAAVLARPSDTTLPGAQQFNAPTPQQIPGQPQFPGQAQFNAGGFGVPGAGLPAGVQLPGNLQTTAGPGAQPGGFQPQFPGQQFPGQTLPPGVQANQGGFQPQFPGQQFAGRTPLPGTQIQNPQAPPGFQYGPNGQLLPAPIGAAAPGQQPVATPGVPGGTPNNAGANAIMNLLTTPRTPPAGVSTTANNAVGGGGIAGVASKHTGASIKVYKERQKYEEWEFVYTPRQGAGGVGGAGGAGQPGGPGQPGQPSQPGRQGQQGGSGGFTGTGLGQGGGFGQGGAGGGFGQQGAGQGAGQATGRGGTINLPQGVGAGAGTTRGR